MAQHHPNILVKVADDLVTSEALTLMFLERHGHPSVVDAWLIKLTCRQILSLRTRRGLSSYILLIFQNRLFSFNALMWQFTNSSTDGKYLNVLLCETIKEVMNILLSIYNNVSKGCYFSRTGKPGKTEISIFAAQWPLITVWKWLVWSGEARIRVVAIDDLKSNIWWTYRVTHSHDKHCQLWEWVYDYLHYSKLQRIVSLRPTITQARSTTAYESHCIESLHTIRDCPM